MVEPNRLKLQTFNGTDTQLQSVTTWPTLTAIEFFKNKLTFQIQHSIFRTKVKEPYRKVTIEIADSNWIHLLAFKIW